MFMKESIFCWWSLWRKSRSLKPTMFYFLFPQTVGKKFTFLLMNTSFNLKRTYHSFERNNSTFSSFATLMYFFSPTDQQSNNHLGWLVSTIFFPTFHPLHFFWMIQSHKYQPPTSWLSLTGGWNPGITQRVSCGYFPQGHFRAQVPQIDTHTDRRFWSHLLLHDPTSVFFFLESPPKKVYKWYKIQGKSFEQSQRTQPYSRENMDCAYETINNMINKTIKNRWLLVFQLCFFSRYGFSDTLQETDIFSPKGTFEDDFPFPFLASLVSPPGCHQPSQPGQKPSKGDKAGAECISRLRRLWWW